MQQTTLHSGTAVSLHTRIDQQDFCIVCAGDADRTLQMRRCDVSGGATSPLLGFERSVFYLDVDEKSAVLLGSTVSFRHMFSNLMIATSRREPSALDSICCAVSVQPGDECGSLCRFHVLPRYKLQHTGDVLKDHDDVVLQLEGFDLYLHLTQANGEIEVNCSEEKYTWTIHKYAATPMVKASVSYGLPVAIHHTERDVFLMLGSDVGDSPFDDIGGGKPMMSRSNKRESNNLWVVEHEDPVKGGSLAVGHHCRLRHATSGLYLCASPANAHSPKSKYLLKAVPASEACQLLKETLFSFSHVTVQENPLVKPLISHMLLKHHKSNMVLRSGTNSCEAFLARVPCLQDAIALVPITPSESQEFSRFLSNLEQIRSYNEYFFGKRRGGGIESLTINSTKKLIRVTIGALSTLILLCTNSKDTDPLTREGLPIGENQQMMIDMNLHALCYTALMCPFSQRGDDKPMMGGAFTVDQITSPSLSEIHTVCRLCYRLLKQMCKGNAAFSFQMQSLIDFMQSQEGYRLHVADTLLEMFSNSAEVPVAIAQRMTGHFVSLLKSKGRSSGYLKFLSKLCVLGDSGVSLNQDIVCAALLDQNRHVLIAMKPSENGQLLVHVPDFKKNEHWVSLLDFLTNGDPKLIKYFETQLELYLCMSKNASERCLKAVESLVSRDCLLNMLRSPVTDDIHIQYIFSMALRLSVEVYLKRDLKFMTHEPECLLLVAGNVVPVASPAVVGTTEALFIALVKKSCNGFLSAQQVQAFDDPERNILLTTAVQTWCIFIKARVYSSDELKVLVGILLKVCDPASDVASRVEGFKEEGWDPCALTAESKELFATKVGIFQLFQLVLDHVVHDTSASALRKYTEPGFSLESHISTAIKTYYEIISPDDVMPIVLRLAQVHSPELTNQSLSFAVNHCCARKLCCDKLSRVRAIGPCASYDEVGRIAQDLSQGLSRRDAPNLDICSSALTRLVSVLVTAKQPETVKEDQQKSQNSTKRWGLVKMLIRTRMFSNTVHRHNNGTTMSTHHIDDVNYVVLHWAIFSMMEQLLLALPLSHHVCVLCLECVKHLSVTPAWAERLQSLVPTFISGVVTHQSTTCLRILMAIVSSTQGQDVDRNIVRRFVEAISPTEDAMPVISALQRIVFSTSPSTGNQRNVLSTLIELDKLRGVAEASGKLNNIDLIRNSALVRLIMKCCLGNSVTQSMAQKVLPAAAVFSVLLEKVRPLPLLHMMPYFVFLGVVHFALDEGMTKLELRQQQKQWSLFPSWWDLVNLVIPLIAKKRTSIALFALEEAILPTLQLFFANMFYPSHVSRDKLVLTLLQQLNTALETSIQKIGSEKNGLRIAMTATMMALRPHARMLKINATTLEHETSPREAARPSPLDSWPLLGEIQTLAASASPPTADDFQSFTKILGTEAMPTTFLKKLLGHLKHREMSIYALKGVIQAMRFGLEDIEGDDVRLRKVQLHYNARGAIMCMMTLFDDDLDGVHDALIVECTRMGIALLEGGNKVVQADLAAFLQSTQETFFLKVEGRINRARDQSRQLEHTRRLVMLYHVSNVIIRPEFIFVHDIMRLLQLMCEGHNLELQNYIRHQPDNTFSVNTMAVFLSFLEELVRTEDIADGVVALLLQTFNLLTELCQGPCHQNQMVLVQNHLCALISRVLTGKEFSSLLEVRECTITTLLSLLEGCNDRYIPSMMLSEVSVGVLCSLMDECIETGSEEAMDLMYNVAILIATLNTFRNYITDSRVGTSLLEAVKKYEKVMASVGRIEIQRGAMLEAVFFRIPDICFSLSAKTKQTLMESVDRSTQGAKHTDFINKSDDVIYEMEHSFEVRERLTKVVPWARAVKLMMTSSKWENIIITLAVIINGFLIFSPDNEVAVLALALCQSYATGHMLILEVALNMPLLLYRDAKKRTGPPRSRFQTVKLFLLDSNIWYRTVMFGFAVIGVHEPDFLGIHLLTITAKSTVLQNVTTAITMNANSLLLTTILGIVTAYLFSLVGYAYFREDFVTEDREWGSCNTMLQCFVFIVTTGIRNGGGVGDTMKTVRWGQEKYVARIVFDFLFWVVMIIIFLNILFGIILDTFAELRDDRNKKEEDIKNVCFVCGLEASQLEQKGFPFLEHCHKDHDMWNYLYFMHHITKKEQDDYTGQESYVSVKLRSRDITFFPQGSCLALSHLSDGPDGHDQMSDEARQIKELVECVEGLKNIIGSADSAAAMANLTSRFDAIAMELKERNPKKAEPTTPGLSYEPMVGTSSFDLESVHSLQHHPAFSVSAFAHTTETPPSIPRDNSAASFVFSDVPLSETMMSQTVTRPEKKAPILRLAVPPQSPTILQASHKVVDRSDLSFSYNAPITPAFHAAMLQTKQEATQTTFEATVTTVITVPAAVVRQPVLDVAAQTEVASPPPPPPPPPPPASWKVERDRLESIVGMLQARIEMQPDYTPPPSPSVQYYHPPETTPTPGSPPVVGPSRPTPRKQRWE